MRSESKGEKGGKRKQNAGARVEWNTVSGNPELLPKKKHGQYFNPTLLGAAYGICLLAVQLDLVPYARFVYASDGLPSPTKSREHDYLGRQQFGITTRGTTGEDYP